MTRTREEAIKELESGYPKDDTPTEECVRYEEAIDMAIEALKETERNPTVTSWHDFDRGYNVAKEKFARPSGEWGVYGAICSNCGKQSDYRTPFCAWCGADMREGEKE